MVVRALIIVDVQNDFLPGGALAVPQGDEVIPVINRLMEKDFDYILATQDWHPRQHGSFAETHGRHPGERILLGDVEQILWPTHCVQGSKGAEISPLLHREKIGLIFHKGIDPQVDSYSTFFDNGHQRSTGLAEYLQSQQVEEVYLVGLATDYCVKYSAIDSIHAGFKTYVIEDACRGINLNPQDTREALDEIRMKGGEIIKSEK